MSAGDAIVIPAGVPHWMKEAEGPLLYFVVKVEKKSGKAKTKFDLRIEFNFIL